MFYDTIFYICLYKLTIGIFMKIYLHVNFNIIQVADPYKQTIEKLKILYIHSGILFKHKRRVSGHL